METKDINETIYCHAVLTAEAEPRTKLRARTERGENWEAIYKTIAEKRHGLPDPVALWDKLRELNIQFLRQGGPDYPPALGEIPDSPLGLYVRGELPPPYTIAIAIVGTRRATPAGKTTAQNFAAALASRGIVIVSGLAFGIDAAAHEGGMDFCGKTVAVLPCGLDRVYPRSHERLAGKILAHSGALVSEYPPGTDPLPYRFLERNRLVSGLARGVIVIEAPKGSGSTATARFAAEQGRDVFVVPGPATHPNYAASHDLIRDGAELVTKLEHVLEAYGLLEAETKNAEKDREIKSLSPNERTVLLFLKECSGPADVDKITERTKLQPQAANATLSFLLIKGFIKEIPGGYVIS